MTSSNVHTNMEALKIWDEPYMAKLRAQKEAAAADVDVAFYTWSKTLQTLSTMRELLAAKADYEQQEKKKLHEQTVAVPKVTVVTKEPSLVATSSAMALDDGSDLNTTHDGEKTAPSNAFHVMMQPKVKNDEEEQQHDEKDDETKSTPKKTTASKAAPKKKTSEAPAKRAKKEQKPATTAAPTTTTEESEHTADGLIRAALVAKNQAALTKEKMSEYLRNPRRASFALAALVAFGMVTEDRKGGRLINRCTRVFLEGNVLDGKGLKVIEEDLSASDDRKAHFVDLTEQETTRLLSNENPKKYKESEKKRTVKYEAQKAVCDEVLRPVPFNKLAPFSFPYSENWQIFVVPYTTADGKKVADMIRVKCYPALVDINVKRAYVNCMFAGENDANGVSLIDLAMIGHVIKEDCKLDIEEFTKAYRSGESIYEWFLENFPAACDASKPSWLQPEHVDLTLVQENADREADEPKRRAPPKKATSTTTTTTDGAAADDNNKKAKSKKSKKIDEAASATGADKVNGKETIAKFSTIASVPGKAPLVATATHVFFASLSSDHEKSAVEKQIIATIEKTDIDAKQDAACPLKSVSAIRSVVAPSSEAKVASNVPKKGKKKTPTTATANGAAAAADDEAGGGAHADEEEVRIPESARAQYFAYAAKIPKASRRMFMGTDLTNSANHTVSDGKKPSTKVESDVKTKDFYSRAITTARLNNHIIFNPTMIIKMLEGANAGKPEWLALLSRSESLLLNSVVKLAYDANTRGDFQIGEENVSTMCQSDKFAAFVANFLMINLLLMQSRVAVGDANTWRPLMALIPNIGQKLDDVGKGWL